ncbi:hypothetical protein NKW54_08655 [Acetobacter cerevisiae]|uniref:Uncharacterized protein n=1 Tax=Acetobacter cerevisiae TaxID=178900 RepID=A0ABT1EUH6_9PROT|nr:hypothetical protein [Acetobacter cerevisiae]MCP1246009.1 hypothetical protein [Acetobacter cerevisiae]MCP1255727.1 hypothetical protein [Acetobacter cerevisiae]
MSEEQKSLILPEIITPDIEKTLGLMCFECARYAHAFKKGGENIAPRAESEQAAIIFKVLRNVLSGMSFDEAFRKMHIEACDAQERRRDGYTINPHQLAQPRAARLSDVS